MNLAPLREALLASVRAELDEQARTEEAAAAERLDTARTQADALVAKARAQGERAARRDAARTRATAVRRAREARLRSEYALVEELRSRARAAALDLRGEPGYDQLLARLGEAAREQLGGQAEIEPDPAEVGGVRAKAGARSVDYTLPALVDRAVAALGEELEALWR